MNSIIELLMNEFNISYDLSSAIVYDLNYKHKIESLIVHLEEFSCITELLNYYYGGE